LKRLYAKVDR
jgi:hypothetical protein